MKDKVEISIKVPNHTRYLSLIGNIGEEIARAMRNFKGNRDQLAFDINLVLTEAMANAIRHGNDCDPDKSVRINIFIEENCLHIQVFDEGQGFDLSTLPQPDLHGINDHGRGMYIIHRLMDHVEYKETESGNVLEMTKKFH